MHHYNEYRTVVGPHEGPEIELHVAALGEAGDPPDSFVVSVRYGCHNNAGFGVDRAGAEQLVTMLIEALGSGVGVHLDPVESIGRRITVGGPLYRPTFPVIDGVETTTERLACCGAGSDRRSVTGERLHFDGCNAVRLDPDGHPDELLDDAVDAGRLDEAVAG